MTFRTVRGIYRTRRACKRKGHLKVENTYSIKKKEKKTNEFHVKMLLVNAAHTLLAETIQVEI